MEFHMMILPLKPALPGSKVINPRRFIQYFCHFAELEDYWLSDSRVNLKKSGLEVIEGSNIMEISVNSL